VTDANLDVTALVGIVREFRARGANLQPVMGAIAESFVAAVNDNFETAGHGNWAALSASTLKKRRGSTAEILKDSGRLAGSIQPYSTEDYAEAATDVSYAIFHVSDKPRTKIPLRNFLELSREQLLDEPTEMVLAYITSGGLA
jgi:phage gpG-like protein